MSEDLPETMGLFGLAPEVFERHAALTLRLIDEGIRNGWPDLRVMQEVVTLGVGREFAAHVFHVKHSRYPAMICIHCGCSFRHKSSTSLRKMYCKSCEPKGPRHVISGEAHSKSIARAVANVAVRRGKLQKQPCSECGEQKAEKHHPDYSRPLEVQWLCRPCHVAEHKREAEAA